MKVRVKFEKLGAMKFIGHLDMMRFFQKAIRRAGIPVAYSAGFSPHMIMSFASPLGVGVTSSGEYFDLELTKAIGSNEMVQRLNEAMTDGVSVLSVGKIQGGKASTGMALVAGADYVVSFAKSCEPVSDWQEKISDFVARDSIVIMKKTKRSEQEVDIRPWIYELYPQETSSQEGRIFMKLASGSVHNLKPELVMEAFYSFLGVPMQEFGFSIHRMEVYADLGQGDERKLVSLESLGNVTY